MNDHASRAHSKWSASATSRRVNCLGSLTLEALVPEPKESIHAARGTACHTIAEKCLTTGADAISFLGDVIATKNHKIEIDEELAISAQTYVDYVRGRMAEYKAETGDDAILLVEQQFDLGPLGTPFDAGGTGDAVLYFRLWKLLEIVDLKNGQGYVSEKNNMQLRSYAVGALLGNQERDVDEVQSTIVQPRIIGGKPVREEKLPVADLIDWTADLLKKMHLAKQAEDEFEVAKDNSVLFDEWSEKWLTPGNCTFCKREGDCPTLRKRAQAVAEVWFDDLDQPRIGNLPGEMSPEKMNDTLNMLPMLEDWVKAVRALAHSMAEQGVDFVDHQLVDKIGNRKWVDDTAAMVEAVKAGGVDPFAEPKLLSPAALEKLLGSKRKALIEPFVVREITGTNLVSRAKTTRPAAKSKAETYFEAQP
ncbi:DUF2800 domain-containing protein [Mesorhizobium sp. ESP7-2]|uniref:DUF2800 domain-containing protein n=1 Tax=Mesorhizobium sp. ESP7-2 TaxID=2876622 RepID=UPI001CCB6E4C|nr:DUF2800 domain-containing protein [Mesorhizobium sp. ESP7-2]MBZ9706112.1 DUF2800 domain-containing protein [Mesorhizobium sp. ESP7-2]